MPELEAWAFFAERREAFPVRLGNNAGAEATTTPGIAASVEAGSDGVDDDRELEEEDGLAESRFLAAFCRDLPRVVIGWVVED